MSTEPAWKKLVEIHNHAKAVFLMAEEVESDGFKAYLQPVQEQRNAEEHIIRAIAAVQGMLDDDGEL